MPSTATSLRAEITVLHLRAAGQTLALARDAVIEILPMPRLASVPEAPPFLAGAFHLGRETVMVVPLVTLLGLSGAPEGDPLYHHLLLLPPRNGQVRLALRVDRVTDIRNAEPEPLPSGQSFNDCVAGDVRVDGVLVPLIDADRLFTAHETATLAAFAARAEVRG